MNDHLMYSDISDYSEEKEEHELLEGKDNEETDFFYEDEENAWDGPSPQSWMNILEMDVKELQSIAKGVNAGYWPMQLWANQPLAPISVFVSMDIKRFQMGSKEHAAAWDLDPSMSIALHIKLDQRYTWGSDGAKVVEVCQTDDVELHKSSFKEKRPFGLSWVIKDRLESLLLGPKAPGWPKSILRQYFSEDDIKIREIMEITEASRDVVIMALVDAKGDKQDAINAIISGQCIRSDKTNHQMISKDIRGQIAADTRNYEEQFSSENFLLRVVHCCEDVLKGVTKTCLVCAEEIPFEGPVPVVCDKDSCIFSHQQYAIGIDVELRIINNPEVVDLLISILYAASKNGRVELMFPEHVFDTSDSERRLVDRGTLTEALDKLPALSEMVQWAAEKNLRRNLDEIDTILYPLLRWILTSNRSHLRLLQQHEKAKDIDCDAQFVLLTGPMEREKKFQEYKKASGAFFAFHGSTAGNWHSILALGLKNMSGTKYMSAGAAYGSGIYMAENFGTSFGYSSQGSGWPQSMYSASARFMAVCEVVNRPNEFRARGQITVVPNEQYVTTRYFLVNPQNCSVTSKNLNFPLQI
mmetsp:Transcript_12956/g.16925  ORF Transcript_12956/g.16925 Transcript_12956/m.16925 type:complete len:583 (+) Transcript_12956:151-1899(+)